MITTTAESIDFVVNPITSAQRRAVESVAPNLLLWGIGGTGKTQIGAEKAILIGSMYPRNVVLLVRKKRIDLRLSLWKRFIELLPREMIVKYNDDLMYVQIQNGTEFYGLGLDSQKDINKLASFEAGLVIVEESTEITDETVYDEKIFRAARLTRVPFHQVILLCNPGQPTHWIKRKWLDQSLPGYEDIFFDKLVPFIHQEWLDWFNGLTGIFRARYHDGQWVGAEGLVYPYDPMKHQIPGSIYKKIFKIPDDWRREVGLDFGFSLMHPLVVQWWAINDDPLPKWFCYRQIYITGRTVGELAPQIRSYLRVDGISSKPILCDHDAEDRGTLNLKGIKTKPANKQRLAGQRSVHDLIAKDRLFFFKDSLVEEDIELKMHKLPVRTEEEFGLYTWANKDKEDMIKKYDHGMDTMRYVIHSTTTHRGDLLYDLKGGA